MHILLAAVLLLSYLFHLDTCLEHSAPHVCPGKYTNLIECCPDYYEDKGLCEPCNEGTYGKDCKEKCPNGQYGIQCKYKCVCSDFEICHAEVGCVCPIGYMGENCTKGCDKGFFGVKCSQICDCPYNAVCDNISGSCYCNPGYSGRHCKPCVYGRFGLNCTSKCDCNGLSCDSVTGKCLTYEQTSAVPILNSSSISIGSGNQTDTERNGIYKFLFIFVLGLFSILLVIAMVIFIFKTLNARQINQQHTSEEDINGFYHEIISLQMVPSEHIPLSPRLPYYSLPKEVDNWLSSRRVSKQALKKRSINDKFVFICKHSVKYSDRITQSLSLPDLHVQPTRSQLLSELKRQSVCCIVTENTQSEHADWINNHRTYTSLLQNDRERDYIFPYNSIVTSSDYRMVT